MIGDSRVMLSDEYEPMSFFGPQTRGGSRARLRPAARWCGRYRTRSAIFGMSPRIRETSRWLKSSGAPRRRRRGKPEAEWR